jgi:hypothetical protein
LTKKKDNPEPDPDSLETHPDPDLNSMNSDPQYCDEDTGTITKLWRNIAIHHAEKSDENPDYLVRIRIRVLICGSGSRSFPNIWIWKENKMLAARLPGCTLPAD